MKTTSKEEFMNRFGEDKWNLYCLYNLGDRSPEATEAAKLYARVKRGFLDNNYTIYGILFDGKIVYVGMTSQTLSSRWTNHKSRARTNPEASPLHTFMSECTSDIQCFPEFTALSLAVTEDPELAQQIETLSIKAYNTHIDGLNQTTKSIGSKPSMKDPRTYNIRPVVMPDVHPDTFGFAAAKRKDIGR